PWGALAGAGVIYLLLLPLSRRSFRRLKREAEALHAEEDSSDLPAV
ncbi:phosphatidylcholine/phosphatidylserine synthase, partial [Komagataeibacter sp. FXV2]|nr:phosphatidylcholine/phosphatidylserine synthase [Komagataeibacter sp. FXV2]